VDLPRNVDSGLRHALSILDGIEGIGVTRFTSVDVVRHPLVRRIIEAYDRAAGERT
jgi:phosphate starvation-inducible PhoH-like protein